MLSRLTLRYKILVSYVIIFVMFMLLMYLFASQLVEKIVINSMYVQVEELIARIRKAPNDNALIKSLRDQKYLIFFRVAIINDEKQLIYDSYNKRFVDTGRESPKLLQYPEVDEALRTGLGISERESKTLHRGFVYMAKTFDFHGKIYVLRTAFPTKFVTDLTDDVEVSLLGFSSVILLLFGMTSWFVINRLTSPVQQIVKAIKPYQEGETATLPEIRLKGADPYDEFSKLAQTLNGLGAKIQSQINILTQERNEKEAVLESLVEGVVAVNEKMVVDYGNYTALKLLNTTWRDIVGQSFYKTEQHKCIKLLEECQKQQTVLHDTIEIKHPTEGTLYLDITAAPKKDLGAILVMEDKSQHYKLLEMRKDFIANASHELKTPITIIHGFAETLHDNPDLERSIFTTIMEKIMRNCRRMTSVIKDLLALTDIENIPESKLLECHLEELIQRCIQMVQDLYPTAMIAIHKEAGAEYNLLGDPYLLEMALMNLLENAAKYSNPPAQITISLSKHENEIELIIADRGIGIPEVDLEHIFERFFTVNKAHSRKLGGSGLGLSIVHTIVEKHFGKISVQSQLGYGTTFTIKLPIDRTLRR